jgi:ABC-type bacteriocin/lantibiotic exporter with double-glycine peptidase domain
LFDIILGLLAPTSGEIRINGERVEGGNYIFSNIGHVSQRVHLFESSILFNITLQEKPSDGAILRAKECLEIVDLHLQVNNLPGGLFYKVGEDGTGLSGGQRQRLGIARALFKCPSLLVLDEATSAIDEATADLVMSNIRNKFPLMTCIRITHRLSESCAGERILSLDHGVLESK